MDETEVQIEIACWAQAHPDAERVNWQGGNEPWVNFPGKLCSLHIGMGDLVWSIGVPVGYQTILNPSDGSRRRCWEPFDFHDTVILPDRDTPFRVSVLYPKNHSHAFDEETILLVQQPGHDYHEAQESVINLLEQLQLSDDSSAAHNQERKLIAKGREFFQAMRKAETLADVLDAIYDLTTLHRRHSAELQSTTSAAADPDDFQRMYSMSSQVNSSSNGESYDDDLFVPEAALNWSWIKAQVDYAADACRFARSHAETGVSNSNSSSSSSGALAERTLEEMDCIEEPTDSSINVISGFPMPLNFDSKVTQITDDYAYVGNSSRSREDSSRTISRCDSDTEWSDGTDESWEDVSTDIILSDSSEDAGIRDHLLPKKCNVPQVYAPERGGGGGAGARGGSNSELQMSDFRPNSCSSNVKSSEVRFEGQEEDVLQFCDISFNSASFSVEVTISLEKFMHNNTAALAAMGLSLEYPLRVEVVPYKEQVDALSWTGLVEVYVSQQSEWHSHVSEEVCGLLCFVPHLVRQYFERVFFNLGSNNLSKRELKGELFVGLMETVITRLLNVSRDQCCICSGPLGQLSRTFTSRIMWPCEQNMCQALYASWQAVSSFDADERTRQEQESLAQVEKDLIEDFPYSEFILDNLKCALDVYGIDSEGLHYGQMIRALARIELWNRRDAERFA